MGKRILVIGATGMLGQALVAQGHSRGYEVVGAARSKTDRTVDLAAPSSIGTLIHHTAPDIVVNAAAMVVHADCEADPCGAYASNARAVAFMSDACQQTGATLVQVSTDQFFTGDGARPHAQDAPVTILPSEYARTKLAGETFALRLPDALVLRTNITGLRGRAGRPTFIEWVFETASAGRPFTLFDDYFTSTIDTPSFARSLFDLVDKGARGRFNLASRDISSKKDFIIAAVQALTGNDPKYTLGSVTTMATPRAESLGLDVGKAEAVLGYSLPTRSEVVDALAQAWKERG